MKKYKTTSKAGIERKFYRLVAQELAKESPELYARLAKRATATIMEDNESTRTHINTWGIGSVKKPSMNLTSIMIDTHAQRNVSAYNDPDTTPNLKVARLLRKGK